MCGGAVRSARPTSRGWLRPPRTTGSNASACMYCCGDNTAVTFRTPSTTVRAWSNPIIPSRNAAAVVGNSTGSSSPAGPTRSSTMRTRGCRPVQNLPRQRGDLAFPDAHAFMIQYRTSVRHHWIRWSGQPWRRARSSIERPPLTAENNRRASTCGIGPFGPCCRESRPTLIATVANSLES